MRKTMKEGTKNILPRIITTLTPKEHFASIELRNKMAAKMDYVPQSIEALQDICPSDVRVMMLNNKDFYDATLTLCDKTIREFIKWAKTVDGSKKVQEAVSLDDLLRGGLYWEDYEQSRKSFVSVFVGKYLYSINPKKGI